MSLKSFFQNLFKEKQTKPKKSFEEIYSDLGIFECFEDCFIITTNEFTKTIMWDEILQINAFLKNLLAYDIIVIEIIHQENVFTINEETPGWYQFVIKTKEIFATIPKDWELKIIQPAFETNFTNLYKKQVNNFNLMKNSITLLILFFTIWSHAQNDKTTTPIFEKIALEMKEFKLDTTSVPNDKLSKRIEQLRSLKGGFNINEAIEFKIAEERSKENAPTEELDKIEAFFKNGNGKKWLNNAVIWIYRKQFTLKEINQLIRFYKSSAGQKMAEKFPILMIQSLKAGEEIKEKFVEQLKK